MIPLLDIAREHAALRPRLLRALARVLDSGAFINGPEVRAFEAEFAKAHRARYCAGLSNGTDAIELALKACGVGPGTEVVVPAFTFIATGSAVCAVGAKPVFADVEEDSLCLDPKALGRALSRLTKAVVPVHLYGHPADMDALMRVARKARLKVVEDCAQAHLARYRGRFVGTLGHAGTFSFYPTKNLGALGDAGAILTGDKEIYAACASLRDAGRAPGKRYLHDAPGRNARLDEMQAALLRVKLEGLAGANAARAEAAEAYRDLLEGLPLRLPPRDRAGSRQVYHVFTVRTPKRDALAAHLKGAGIGTGVYYPLPLHLQPAFASWGHGPGDFPVSERASREVLALPMFPGLGARGARRVCREVRRFFGKRSR